jgi:hypothetical protein
VRLFRRVIGTSLISNGKVELWRYCSIDGNPGGENYYGRPYRNELPLDRQSLTQSMGLMIAGNCQWDDEVSRLLLASMFGAVELAAVDTSRG